MATTGFGLLIIMQSYHPKPFSHDFDVPARPFYSANVYECIRSIKVFNNGILSASFVVFRGSDFSGGIQQKDLNARSSNNGSVNCSCTIPPLTADLKSRMKRAFPGFDYRQLSAPYWSTTPLDNIDGLTSRLDFSMSTSRRFVRAVAQAYF